MLKMKEDEMEVYYLINEERIAHGLEPLILDNRLIQSAHNKIEDMKTKDKLNNEGFVSLIREQTGGDYNRFGEIVTMGDNTKKIFKNITKCSGKKSNILNPAYTHVGLGILYYFPKTKMAAVHFASEK